MVNRIPDRAAAGRLLGAELASRPWHRPLVVGLPRGGVVVAAAVAAALAAAAEVYVAGKLSAPHQPEYAIGAIAEDGGAIWSDIADELLPGPAQRKFAVARTCEENRRRVRVYRGTRSLPRLVDRSTGRS
jgi:predicted phosphoribosyltransferase